MYRRASPDSRSMEVGNGSVIKMCGEEIMGKKLLFCKFLYFYYLKFVGGRLLCFSSLFHFVRTFMCEGECLPGFHSFKTKPSIFKTKVFIL